MSERNYYVVCEDNCRFPSMTSEQILAAIAEATGNTPTSVDDAFITKIREYNHNSDLTFWAGTQAEYNALVNAGQVVEGRFYIITDETFGDDVTQAIEKISKDIEQLTNWTNVTEWTAFTSGNAAAGYYKVVGKICFVKLNYLLVGVETPDDTPREAIIELPSTVTSVAQDMSCFIAAINSVSLIPVNRFCYGIVSAGSGDTKMLHLYNIPKQSADVYLRGTIIVPTV